MIAVVLLLIVGGIGLTQAVSDPNQVTLRWLRLGGIIAVCLLAVATTLAFVTPQPSVSGGRWVGHVVIFVLLIAQLLAVQMGLRTSQRIAAGLGFLGVWLVVSRLLPEMLGSTATTGVPRLPDDANGLDSGMGLVIMTPLSGGLMGGFLMAMLLGHAYLTAGNEMTQTPFRRLVLMLSALLMMRAVASGWGGAWPCLTVQTGSGLGHVWTQVMITARYAVGLVVPGVFVYMIHDCVKRRANQSATGILYVATVLVILGEGIGFALTGSTGYVF